MKNGMASWSLVLGLVLALGATGCGTGDGGEPIGDADTTADISGEVVACDEAAQCDDENPCTTDECVDGVCQWTHVDNTCDDGNACTENDICAAGECEGTLKVCDDGEYCNGVESCNAVTGACEDGEAPVVDDGVDCTMDECDEDTDKVVHVPNDAQCDDGNTCTSNVCDQTLGCQVSDRDGEDCEDGSLCTVDDTCDGDTCVGVDVVCDDGEFCNGLEPCDPDTGDCADGTSPELDDGIDCTVDECDEENDAITHIGDDTFCDDDNSCTVDTCDLEQGCLFDTLDDGESCDDENECTEDDVCGGGVCLPGKFICVEDCDNETDDDQDDLVDCDDDDCALDMSCQPGGDLCGEAFDLTLGLPLTAADAGAMIQFFGTTVGKTNVFSGSCDDDTAAAADTVHKVELAEALGLQISADFDGGAWAALYILNESCTEDFHCATMDSSDPTTLTVVLQPGTYFITVDGAYPGDVGTYTLEVEVFMPSDTEVDCGDGIDNDADGLVDCDDDECVDAEICNILTGETCEDALLLTDAPLTVDAAGTEVVITGTTVGNSDDVSGSCIAGLANTPDLIYTFELTDPLIVSASFDFNGNKWPALYLFSDSCEADNELACATAKSEAATLSMGLPAGTYYLVLDASYNNDAGPFTLTVAFDVLPDAETDCANGIDDDLNGLTDCDDPACGEDPLCVGYDGDNCAKPFLVNEGLPVTADLYGQTLTYTDTTDGLQDFYGACAVAATGSPDAVYMMDVLDPVVVHVTHDFEDPFWPALYVMGGDCDTATLLGCDTATSGAAELTLALPVGTYYFVLDANYAGDAGLFTFELTFAAPPATETICYDGMDDDVDGLVDCADDDCAADLYCADIYEPNDTLEIAWDLGDMSNGAFVTAGATVSPAGMDVDLFVFSIQGDHDISLTLTPSGGLDGKVTILDADGVTQVSADAVGVNLAETLDTMLAGPGTYYVWVTGYGITEGSYVLDFTLNALNEYDCANGDDEDGDGLVDCCDDDCAAEPICAAEDFCLDGLDNDCDGLADCDDEDCMGTAACGAADTCEDVLAINDGVAIDATYDGVVLEYQGTTIGYADDFTGSCDDDTASAADAVWELVVAETVAVNVGMDYEGYMWPAVYITAAPCGEGEELSCGAAGSGWAWTGDTVLEAGTYYIVADGSYAGDEEIYQLQVEVTAVYDTEIDCGDGLDNDFDGLLDCCDDDCVGNEACVAETVCDDGLDNDCDGTWDCGDDDCALVPACEGEGCAAAAVLNDGAAIMQADDGLQIVVNGDTSTAQNDHAGSCDDSTEDAKDLVYTFEIGEAIGVSIAHDFEGYNWPAVYLFGGDCMPDSELACAAATGAPAVIPPMLLEPGIYFVVVDSSFSSDAGAFTLTLDFALPAADETDCHDGIDNDLNGDTDCNDAACIDDVLCKGEVCATAYALNEGTPITAADDGLQLVAEGDTTDATPDVTGSCDSDTAAANDLVYTFTLDDAMGVQVTYDFEASGMWPTVYVFSGDCVPENEIGCASTTGDPAVISYMVYQPGTYYVVADASYSSDKGAFTLTVDFLVMSETEVNCADGVDNDLDGLTDCCDDECAADAACLAETLCDDDIDNDCDGAMDCADSDCALDIVCGGESCDIPWLLNGGVAVASGDLPLQLVETGDTSDAGADEEGSCDSDTAAAKDRVYMLDLDTTASVTISHDFDGNNYPAVYVFEGECILDAELACATATTGAAVIADLALEAGTYYIVVDSSWATDAGTYTLTVDIAEPITVEDNCNDGEDNDNDGFADCDDDDCGPEICDPEALPWSEDFSYLPGDDVKGGIWGSSGNCGWELTADLDLNGFAEFDYATGCSETEPYWIVGAILDVQACSEISVTFDEAGDFVSWAVSHKLGIFDGFTLMAETELPLDALTAEWATVGPYTFDVSDLDFIRLGAGYMGDNADTWRIDNFAVECTVAMEICDDGIDNDGDLDIDCDDDDCAEFIGCLGEDCAAPIPLAGAPVALADAPLQVEMTGDTTGHTSEYEGTCDSDTATSPDLVYVFELAETMYVSVSHDFDGTFNWSAAYLFSGTCETANELACDAGNSGASEFGLLLDAGTYYVVVDASYDGDEGPYTLTVDFLAPPPAEETGLCDDDVDNDIDGFTDCEDDDCAMDPACAGGFCLNPFILYDTPIGAADAGLQVEKTGDTGDWANDHGGSCSSGSDTAKDAVYLFELSETMVVTGSHDFVGTYAWSAIYVFAGSCETANELACETGGGGAATFELTLDAGTYYIVVDADYATDSDEYTLTVDFASATPATETDCTDGVDNDLDLLTDCDDVDDCAADPGCGDDDADGVPNHLDVCDLGDDAVDADANGVPDACQIGWAGEVWPNSGTESDTADAIDVYVQVYMGGITDAAADAAGAGIQVNLVYQSATDADPATVAMAYNQDVGNNDEFMATIPADATVTGEAMAVSFEVMYVSGENEHLYEEDITDQADVFPISYIITEAQTGNPNLYFSEYVEGGSNNKAVEIYNAGDAAIDLQACSIYRYSNGAGLGDHYEVFITEAQETLLGAGEVWVVCNSGIVDATNCDFLTSALNHNGDDALALVCGGDTTWDIIGKIGEDPAAEFWGTGDVTTKDDTLRRKCSVTTGDTTGDDDFDPAGEWDGAAKDDLSDLGQYICN